jgi:hypothetical protein
MAGSPKYNHRRKAFELVLGFEEAGKTNTGINTEILRSSAAERSYYCRTKKTGKQFASCIKEKRQKQQSGRLK